MPENKKKTRGNLAVMGRLVGLVKPLAPVMVAAVLLGVTGFLCAIFITVLGAYALLDSILPGMPISLGTVRLLLPVLAIARGVLHYAEQACNHFIAFKLLALIRDKVFGALRQARPRRSWRGGTSGDLIAVHDGGHRAAGGVLRPHHLPHLPSPVVVSAIMVGLHRRATTGMLGLHRAAGPTWLVGLLVPVAAALSPRGALRRWSFRAPLRRAERLCAGQLCAACGESSCSTAGGPRRLAQSNWPH